MKTRLRNLLLALALLAGIRQTQGSPFVIYSDLYHTGVRAAFDGTNYLVGLQYLSLVAPNTNSSVGAQLVSPSASLIGPPILLAAVGDPPLVAFDGNNYLVLWADYSDVADGVPIMGQFIDTQGATVGATFQIGADPDVLDVRRVVFGAGNYLVVWADTNGLLGQLVSPGGQNVGNDFYIGGTNDSQAGLAFDGTNYLVAWPAPGHGVYGQFVSSTGALVDSSFLIDSNALTSHVPSPDVLFDGDRYIVSVVDGTGPTGSQAWKIFARVVTTSGTVLADRFTIAADAGDQLAPSGAFDGTNYLFSWNSGLGGNTVNIKGRFFDSALAPLGAEFEVFGSQGVNVPEAPTVLFGGNQYLVTAGLGHFDTSDFSFDNYPGGGIAYGDFIPMYSPPPDTIPPTLTIISPKATQLWSNALFTVTGTARDNVGVANVFYSLNGADWAVAVTFNQWSNWTAQVTLAPGTNRIQACAVDTSGNVSKTNTANVVYLVSAPLTVSTNGVGALTPNDNGVPLELGKNYSITASAVKGAGFAFVNWTGGTSLPLSLLTNKPTVQFKMVPNLMLQANYVDTNRPTVTVTSPKSSQVVSNSTLAVSGTAHDQDQITGVFCQFNGGDWISATTANNWSNWTATLNLDPATPDVKTEAPTASGVSRQDPGPDLVRTYGVDIHGHFSITNVVTFIRLKPTLKLSPLPNALLGQPYSEPGTSWIKATGGTPPYYYTLETGGGFPPLGIIMDLNGNLSGTPVAAGKKTFGVCVVDSVGTETIVQTSLNVVPAFPLGLAMAGTGSGTVTANPPGVAPQPAALRAGEHTGGTVTADSADTASGLLYASGTVVKLTAAPAAGSTFAGWSGDASGTGTATVTMTTNKTVTATFNLSAGGTLSGTWTGSYTVPYDDLGDATTFDTVWILHQSGNSVSGRYTSTETDDGEVTTGDLNGGSVSGTSFTIYDDGGLQYVGTISGTTISGAVNTGSSVPGTFSVSQ